MELWYRGGSFQEGGADIFLDEVYQGYHFYIYIRNNFSVKIVTNVWTYIYFSSCTILKKKVTMTKGISLIE